VVFRGEHCGVVRFYCRSPVFGKYAELAAVPFLIFEKNWVLVAC